MREIKDLQAGAPVTVRDRLRHEDTTAVLQADIWRITARVFDRNSTTPTVAVDEWDLDIPTVVFDTLQDDSAWDDPVGFNFKWTVDGSWFPQGGSHYHVDIEVEVDSGADLTPTAPIVIEFDVKTKGRAAN